MDAPPESSSPRLVRLRNGAGGLAAAGIAGAFATLATPGGYALAAATVVAGMGTRGGPLLGQLASRSYFLLLAAVVAPVAVVTRDPTFPLLFIAALVALLAPDPEPLREASDRRGFSPIASRDGFLLSATVAMTAAVVLTVSGGVELARSTNSILGWSSLGLAFVAAAGVVATLRMRAAGFIALATAGATSSMLALALLDGWVRRRLGAGHDPFVFTSFAMGGAAFSTMWVPLLMARRNALSRWRVADGSETNRYRVEEPSFEANQQSQIQAADLDDVAVPDRGNMARLSV